MVKELDTVKNKPGRPGRLARDFSSGLRTLMAFDGMVETLRPAGPRVTRRLWLGGPEVSRPIRPGLDLTHGDHTIINRVLWLAEQGHRVVFLTYDTFAAATAKSFEAPYMFCPRTGGGLRKVIPKTRKWPA